MRHVARLPTGSSEVASTLRVLAQIFPTPRSFAIRLWEGTCLSSAGNSAFTLVLNHPGALRRMLKPPIELSLGEAFIYGDIDLEGDIFEFFPQIQDLYDRGIQVKAIMDISRTLLTLPASGPDRPSGRGRAQMHGDVHSIQRDRLAIHYHYDMGASFSRSG